MTNVITDDGKNNLLNVGFGLGGSPFLYMAVGVGTEAPTNASTALNSECTITNGDYSRVTLINTADTDEFMIVSEGTFLTTNITNNTTIREIGIVDTDTLEEGVFWCICQVADTVKDSTKQVKFTIYSTMLECCPG
jgi:hypothetical protein